MIKTIPQAIDDMAVSLGASPSAGIPTVAQALENVYTALGGDRTDLDTLVVSEVIDLVAPLIQGGGGGGDFSTAEITIVSTLQKGSIILYLPNIDPTDDALYYQLPDEYIPADGKIQAVLYKGSVTFDVDTIGGTIPELTVTGGISVDGLSGTITGDGTISIDRK